MPGLQITVTNRQSTLAIERRQLGGAVRGVLHEAGVRRGSVSLALVDDPTIHDLNRRFLKHDYPTDVLSFLLEQADGYLEGELIVSADTAACRAAQFGWTAAAELLLYVIHGALHLVGYDDQTPRQRTAMRARERDHLRRLGLEVRYDRQTGK